MTETLARMLEVGVRRCTRCKSLLHLDQFHRQVNGPAVHRTACKACVRAADAARNGGGRAAAAIRERRKRDPERYAAYTRDWAQRNKEKRRQASREYWERKRGCAEFRMKRRLSVQLFHMLRGTKARRKTVDLLGYGTAELIAHVERQFLPGMTWQNIGEWHIDHIVPLASFKITGPDDPELRRAWALSNLRPIWADDNKRKSAKREFLI